ncbi:MAG: RluA family pseudouridine synthase [Desulfurivibrio sp.]|jgi:23S rRNA pseudouridine1911/1915/1917 synthase|nr:MAG: RluA family pseudouridine synthase [Desulfurivibrio sp.]
MKKMVAKEGMSLLSFLTECGYSKKKVKQLVKHRAVLVSFMTAKRHDHPLLPGDEVIVKTEKEMSQEGHQCPGLEIVYEDEDVIVINKPAGLLTIATEKEKIRTAYYKLTAYLRERSGSREQRIFIVHRLDRDTSGLLVFAKNESAQRTLQDNWPAVDKKYAAIVEGVPKEKTGQVASHLREAKSLRVYSVRDSDEESRYSVTSYEVMKEGSDCALLDIALETGRKNQIRVHMADIGHPVVGDKKYGAKTDPLGRLGLHAYHLAFDHPTMGKRLEFQIKMPGKFSMLFPKKSESNGDAPKSPAAI